MYHAQISHCAWTRSGISFVCPPLCCNQKFCSVLSSLIFWNLYKENSTLWKRLYLMYHAQISHCAWTRSRISFVCCPRLCCNQKYYYWCQGSRLQNCNKVMIEQNYLSFLCEIIPLELQFCTVGDFSGFSQWFDISIDLLRIRHLVRFYQVVWLKLPAIKEL